MNSRHYRIIAGFLCAFVVISLAPRAPAIADAVMSSTSLPAAWAMIANIALPTIDLSSMVLTGISLPHIDLSSVLAATTVQGDGLLPLAGAGALALLCLASIARRQLQNRAAPPASAVRIPAWARGRRVARVGKNDTLGEQIRLAAAQGEEPAALARRFGVSQDAIRAAIGRQPSGDRVAAGDTIRKWSDASASLPLSRPAKGMSIACQTHA